jgi:hypothetical protein
MRNIIDEVGWQIPAVLILEKKGERVILVLVVLNLRVLIRVSLYKVY